MRGPDESMAFFRADEGELSMLLPDVSNGIFGSDEGEPGVSNSIGHRFLTMSLVTHTFSCFVGASGDSIHG